VPHEQRPKKARTVTRARRKNAPPTKTHARPERAGKGRARAGAGGDVRGAVAVIRGQHALVRLLEALEAEKIRYVMIGMSAAIAQGVVGSTLDIDLWIDLPPRQYMRVLNIARRLGASVAANTVVYLENGIPVNFVYEVTGLGKFRSEARQPPRVLIAGHATPVLPLKKILQSKRAIGRDKDKLHIHQIQEFLRCREALKGGN